MYKIITRAICGISTSRWLGLVVILTLVLLFNLTCLLYVPPIWPDEALHADLAINILQDNRYGTDLLSGTLPGVEKFGFGYPPLFFSVSALWIKFFGFSIYSFRILPLSLGILFLVLFIQVSKSLFKDSNHKNSLKITLLSLSILLLLNSDIAFIKSIHIARPEIQVLLLGFLSLYCYLKTITVNRKIIFYFICGLALSFAFLTHFLAIIFIFSLLLHSIIFDSRKFYSRREIYIFLMAFLIPIFIWFINIYPHLNFFLNDITLRLRYKTNAPNWLWISLQSQSLITKIIYLLYIAILIISVYVSFVFKTTKGFLTLFLLLFSWIFAYLWQTEYSFIYVVVFSYLQFGYLIYLDFITKNSVFKVGLKIYLFIALLFLSLNILNDINIFKNFNSSNFSYKKYTNSLLEIIPDNVTIYLSAIPDPYFGFKNVRHNTLYEFPVLPTTKDNLTSVLDKSDYIIINSPLETIVTENTVYPYIQNNMDTVQIVGSIDQYQAAIVKLKPRHLRNHN